MSVAAFSKRLQRVLKERVLPEIEGSGDLYRAEKAQNFHVMEISPKILLAGNVVDSKEEAAAAMAKIKKKIGNYYIITKDQYDAYKHQVKTSSSNDIKLFGKKTGVYKTAGKIVIFANNYKNLYNYVASYVNPYLTRNADLGHTIGLSTSNTNDAISSSRIQDSLSNAMGDTRLKKVDLKNLIKLRKNHEKYYRTEHIRFYGDLSKNVDITKNLMHGNLEFTLVLPQSENLNRVILKNVETKIINDLVKDIDTMKGSKSILRAADEQLNSKFLEQPVKGYKSKTKTSGSKKVKIAKEKNTTTYTLPKLRDTKGRYTSTLKIKELLQPLVTAAVGMNMDSANYFKTQTGRFTKSVKIEDVIQSDRSVIVKYNYMQYPYSVFESGGSHHRAGRAPTQIISGSIRQAATQLVGRKFNIIPQLKDY